MLVLCPKFPFLCLPSESLTMWLQLPVWLLGKKEKITSLDKHVGHFGYEFDIADFFFFFLAQSLENWHI